MITKTVLFNKLINFFYFFIKFVVSNNQAGNVTCGLFIFHGFGQVDGIDCNIFWSAVNIQVICPVVQYNSIKKKILKTALKMVIHGFCSSSRYRPHGKSWSHRSFKWQPSAWFTIESTSISFFNGGLLDLGFPLFF